MRPRLLTSVLVPVCLVVATAAETPGVERLAIKTPGVALQDPVSLTQDQTRPTFRGGSNLVLVDAYPQRNGQIVEGLTAADFEVFEDGKAQTIANIEFVRVTGNVPETARRDPNTIADMKAMAADPHNRVFVAFLDTFFATVEGSNRIRVPLVQTLNRLIGPEDLFGVMTPVMGARDVTFARRMLTTEDQLSRYWAWGERTSEVPADKVELGLNSCFKFLMLPDSGLEPWKVPGDSRTLNEILIERRREDLVLQRFESLVPYLGSLREARSVVLAITDGWPNLEPAPALQNQPARDMRAKLSRASGKDRVEDGDFWGCTSELNRLAPLDNRRRWREVMAAANRANVSFYPIAPNGLAAFDVGAVSERPGEALGASANYRMMQTRVQTMVDLATNTDGIAIVNRNDVGAAMTRVIDDISAYYLLGYYSTNDKADGRFRKIDVKMKQPGLAVHARRGYVAEPVAASASTAPRATASVPASAAPTAAIDAALATLTQLRPSTEVFIYGTASGHTLSVTVELASAQLETSTWRAGGSVDLDVQSGGQRVASATGKIDAGARGVLLSVPVTAPGPYVIRARASTGDIHADSDQVVVAVAAPGVLGPAVLYRAAASPRAPLRPMADLQVRRTERLHVEWPVFGPLDQRSVRLLDRRGQPLPIGPALTEHDVDGQPFLAADLALAALAEGDYVLEARATRGADTGEQRLAFRVVR